MPTETLLETQTSRFQRFRNVFSADQNSKYATGAYLAVFHILLLLTTCTIFYTAHSYKASNMLNSILFIIAIGLYFLLCAITVIMHCEKKYKIKKSKGLINIIIEVIILLCCALNLQQNGFTNSNP